MSRRAKGQTFGKTDSPPRSKAAAGHAANPVCPESQPPKRWLVGALCFLLALAVWIVFGQTISFHEFVNYDDGLYVYENESVIQGLSLKGIVWAFTHLHVDEWWPLNTISHMLDCELFGLDAGGHHFTNVLLHTATVVLLFLVLRSMTGAFWRSAFVAAVFAIHPLRVESVAWVTERKDVLSGLFFVLTLGAYVRYARRPFALGRYLLVLFLFTLGLLSKSSVVTMPFLFLLLDWWPLQRVRGAQCQVSGKGVFAVNLTPDTSHLTLLIEKIPFLLLAIAGSAATMFAVKDLHPIGELGFPWRIANAFVSYATYIWQMIYPVGLAVFYPHPENQVPLATVGLSLLGLVIISAAVTAGWRKRPYLLVGWLWYLGMLVTVIGLVQVGIQAHADRYTYLPQIGLYILVAWGAADLCASCRHRRAILSTAAAAILIGFVLGASIQTTHWRNSKALWSHTVACTSANPMAHHSLGNALMAEGKVDEAIAQYKQAIQFKPDYVRALNNLGVALSSQGRLAEAIPHFQRVVQLRPQYANARFNLAVSLATQGLLPEAVQHFERLLQLQPDSPEVHYHLAVGLVTLGNLADAISHFERALQLKPDRPEAHKYMGVALASQGKLSEAIEHYQQALKLSPRYARARYRWGDALAASGKWEEARQQYEQALQINPNDADVQNNLGNVLVTLGRLDEAIPHFERTLELNPGIAEAHGNLGMALAAQGKSGEAISHLRKALELAKAQANTALAQSLQAQLQSYQSSSPNPETP
jgi:tetratricopeptide (TPR) repeat protein